MKMEKFILTISLALLPLVVPAAENLIANGGFEDDAAGWGYEEWKGLPLPGRIGEEKPYAGKKCFVLTEPGKMTPRYIRCNQVVVDRGRNYVLRFALAPQNIVSGSIKVRILQYGAREGKTTPVVGWLTPGRPGVHDLIPDLTGTADWKVYEIALPGKAFDARARTAAVYFQHQHPGLGELKIDAVELLPVP